MAELMETQGIAVEENNKTVEDPKSDTANTSNGSKIIENGSLTTEVDASNIKPTETVVTDPLKTDEGPVINGNAIISPPSENIEVNSNPEVTTNSISETKITEDIPDLSHNLTLKLSNNIDNLNQSDEVNTVAETIEKTIAENLSQDSEKEKLETESNLTQEEDSDDAINTVIKDIIDALQSSGGENGQGTSANATVKNMKSVSSNALGVLTEDEWKKRENVLLERISKMEEEEHIKHEALKIKLKLKCEENDIVKSKLKTLELELRAVCSKPNAKNKDMVSKIKRQHEELLTKARGMIFDKTKMISNQELQIEALTSQVTSLKDVVAITKDLLNIRNLEVEHLQERLECMDLKIQAERERQNFMMKKVETSNKLNEELKKEYEKQMELFKCLKEKYEEKFRVLERNQVKPSTSQNGDV